ncbi:MAG: outer membrane beta-barrel family protein [Bacteroidales bacterium]|nr:outer membrane beta-barrel family protein [Bacteroidales bacterium]
MSFYANTNNLNQNQKPGRSGDWNNQWASAGRIDMMTGGLDLQLNDKKGVYQLNSDLTVRLEDIDSKTLSSGVAFLPNYDRYTFGRNNSDNKNTAITTNHELILKKPYLWSKFQVSASYSHSNNKGLDQGAEFNEKLIESYRGEVLDSLFSPNQYISFASALVNSHQEKNLSKGDQYNTKLYSYVSWHDFRFVANALYNKRTTKEFSQYGLNYGEATTDFRNRYIDRFSERFSYDLMAEYSYILPDHEDFSVALSYNFAGKHHSGDKALYRLDEYNDWNSFNGHPLGYLPSTRDSLLQVMDLQNSYFSTEQNREHTPSLHLSYNLPTKDQAGISLSLPLHMEHDELSYKRAQLDTIVKRNTILFNPTLSYGLYHYSEKINKVQQLNYSFKQSAPNMVSMLNIQDDSNPLLIQLGNPDLHNEKSHKIEFSHTYSRQENQRNLGINVDWEVLMDAIAQSMTYNEESGVRTYIPQNINGNWNIGARFNFGQAIDKQKLWHLSTTTGIQYINSVDWISLTDIENSIKSKVKNLNFTEVLKIDYRKEELHIGATVRGKWTHTTSERDNFSTINSLDLNYGVSAVLPLPFKFRLSTDLTLYTRRGYTYDTMNTEDFVWNATLSRSILRGNLTFFIDGFDILGQLSNVRQTLNSQGRIETWFNSIPQYVMLRVIYRLNKEPKK